MKTNWRKKLNNFQTLKWQDTGNTKCMNALGKVILFGVFLLKCGKSIDFQDFTSKFFWLNEAVINSFTQEGNFDFIIYFFWEFQSKLLRNLFWLGIIFIS